MMKRLIMVFVVLLLITMPAGAALADSTSDTVVEEGETINNDVIVFDGDLEIKDDAVVNGDVIVFNGDAALDGTINGDLVIFNGDLDTGSAAAINGDCVLLNGSVDDSSSQGIGCTNIEGATLPGFVTGVQPIPAVPAVPAVPELPETPKIPPVPAARMWQAISAATKPIQYTASPKARIFSLNPIVYRIAIAASLMAAVAISWMLFIKTPAPELLAVANQEVSNYTLADGSTVALRPHSKLYRLTTDGTEDNYLLEGEGFFDVTRNENRTFSVVAGNAQVSVLGTEFNVSSWQTAVTVFLQEGRIELKNQRSGQAVILSPGQTGTVDFDQVTLHGQPANSAEHLDWLNDEISFFGTPLHEVIKELEFHFAISIEIPQDRAGETISGSIVLEDISFVLDNLSFVMQGGSFVQTGEHSYRFEAN